MYIPTTGYGDFFIISYSLNWNKFVYICIYNSPLMKNLRLKQGRLELSDDVIGFFEREVTKFGNGAKIDCPKEFLGKRVYVIVCKN